MIFDVLIVGGGAAGFFSAIQIAEGNPNLKILILERGKEVLTKVKISGGGRCNVTHAEFVPNELAKSYPRGKRELRGPFHTFASGDTMTFFEERGVALKIEEDGRIFPQANTSQAIIDCFMGEIDRLGVKLNTQCAVKNITQLEDKTWKVDTTQGEFLCRKLLIASGSSPKMWKLLENLGHTVIPPVPSLFTFNIKDSRVNGLMGLSTPATVQLLNTKGHPLKIEGGEKAIATGPLLITHWGMSGPAILKLSAWGARVLHEHDYQFKIKVNWLQYQSFEETLEELKEIKTDEARKTVFNTRPFDLPKRLWFRFLEVLEFDKTEKWAEVSHQLLYKLAKELTEAEFSVNGKSTFKEEFVTAGGVDLRDIDFKTFQSKRCEHLYLAGEVLNIDAITGGFNFQNAWTGAFIAAQDIVG